MSDTYSVSGETGDIALTPEKLITWKTNQIVKNGRQTEVFKNLEIKIF